MKNYVFSVSKAPKALETDFRNSKSLDIAYSGGMAINLPNGLVEMCYNSSDICINTLLNPPYITLPFPYRTFSGSITLLGGGVDSTINTHGMTGKI